MEEAGSSEGLVDLVLKRLLEYGIIEADGQYELAGTEDIRYSTTPRFDMYFREELCSMDEELDEDRYYESVLVSMLKTAGGFMNMESRDGMIAAIGIVTSVCSDMQEARRMRNSKGSEHTD